MNAIRAVYRNGQLHPLDPVNLTEGQEVRLQIVDDRQQVRDILADMLVPSEPPTDVDFDADALQQWVDEATQGVTISDIIIEERREGR